MRKGVMNNELNAKIWGIVLFDEKVMEPEMNNLISSQAKEKNLSHAAEEEAKKQRFEQLYFLLFLRFRLWSVAPRRRLAIKKN